MLDPRIESLFEEVKAIKKAVQKLADYVDSLAWRSATEEERKGINIVEEIAETLNKKEELKKIG